MLFGLSKIAQLIEPLILSASGQTSTLLSMATSTIFMKGSVILTDLTLLFSLLSMTAMLPNSTARNFMLLSTLTMPGPLISDHLQFGYNGFFIGLLILTISLSYKGKEVAAGFFFILLCNMKREFLFLLPIYCIFTFRKYCWVREGEKGFELLYFNVFNAFKIFSLYIAIFALSIGPWLYYLPWNDVLQRLYLDPLGSQLLSNKWTPNFWNLFYSFELITSWIAQGSIGKPEYSIAHIMYLPEMTIGNCVQLLLLIQLVRILGILISSHCSLNYGRIQHHVHFIGH